MIENKEDITLVIYTHTFPFGKGETFLENEIPILARRFKKIIFVPMTDRVGVEDEIGLDYRNNQRIETLPTNCHVKMSPDEYSNYGGGMTLLKELGLLAFIYNFTIFIPTLITAIIKDKKSFFYDYRTFIFSLFSLFMRAKVLNKFIKSFNSDNLLHYSFWMYEWSTILSILKKTKKINFFIARGHGNDIYTENYGSFEIKKNKETKQFGSYIIRYRHFELQYIDFLFPVSIDMEQYLYNKYPEYKNKIKKIYLGVPVRDIINPYKRDIFRIVTVSNVIPLKRVFRMLNILNHIDVDVEWNHFGAGPLFNDLKKKSIEFQNKKNNIKIKLHGRIANSELIKFYKQNHVSLLINLSINEGGAPVSITEALSMGIPIIATDAGGNREAVPDKKYIVGNNFEDTEIVKLIMDIYNMRDNDYLQLRNKCIQLHKDKFDTEKNYNEFIDKIVMLHKDIK